MGKLSVGSNTVAYNKSKTIEVEKIVTIIKEIPVEKEVIKEIIIENPIEVIKIELKEIIKEVIIEKPIEIIKIVEKPIEFIRIKYIDKVKEVTPFSSQIIIGIQSLILLLLLVKYLIK